MNNSKFVETGTKNIQKEILYVGIIIIGALIFRISITSWNFPSLAPDVLIFFTEAFNFSNNNYEYFNSRFFWPFVLSLFFRIFEFPNYLNYVDFIRIISIGFSVSTIPIIYGIGKKFVEPKYSILVTVFFAFNLQIVENSTWGITEPLFLLLSLGSVYFMLNYDSKYSILSFVLAGLAFDTRLNGIVILIILFIGYFMKVRPKKKCITFVFIGLIIFIIISMPHYYQDESTEPEILSRVSGTVISNNNEISPHLIESAKIFLSDEQLDPNSKNFYQISSIEKNLFGIIKETYHIVLLNLPFLLFLVPVGVFYILKQREWKKIIVLSIVILSIIIAIPQYTISAELRNLLLIIPFTAIIGTIGLENIIKKYSRKNFIILGIIILTIVFSVTTINVDDKRELTIEKEMFGKYVAANYSGKITGDLLYHVENNLINLENEFIKYKENEKIKTEFPFFSVRSEVELHDYLIENKISYVIIDNIKDNRYLIFENIFDNDTNYSFLQKVYDSKDGFNKIQIKIFKVITISND